MRIATPVLVSILIAALLPPARGQQAPPGPVRPGTAKTADPFENLIERALRSHPEVALAEAKARQAQAELSLVRMKVAEAVQVLQHQRTGALAKVNLATTQLHQAEAMASAGTASRESLQEAMIRLDEAKQELALIELRARNMAGAMDTPADGASSGPGYAPGADPPAPLFGRFASPDAVTTLWQTYAGAAPIPDAVQKALQQPVLQSFADVPCAEAIRRLVEPFNILVVFEPRHFPDSGPAHAISLSMQEPLPLKAVLAYLGDAYKLRFDPRDYGLRVSKGP